MGPNIGTTAKCPTCSAATEYVNKGVLYRKDRLPSRHGQDERCEDCGTATPASRARGYVDLWIADSVGMH